VAVLRNYWLRSAPRVVRQTIARSLVPLQENTPEWQELIEAAERVCHDDFGKTSAVTLLKKKAVTGKGRQPLDLVVEFWRARQDLNPRPPGS
jgi:hypothetical protein